MWKLLMRNGILFLGVSAACAVIVSNLMLILYPPPPGAPDTGRVALNVAAGAVLLAVFFYEAFLLQRGY